MVIPRIFRVPESGRQFSSGYCLHCKQVLGTLFMTILAVKYRHLIQTGNLHFSHSLARAKEDATEAAVQIRNLWNVNVLHASLYWKQWYLLNPLYPPCVIMAHLPLGH